jgi:autotransporter-associated beta strand protein
MNAASVCPLPRVLRFATVAIAVLAGTLLFARSAVAQSSTPPYYPPGSYTAFRVLEAVNPDGTSSFSVTNFPTTVMGIVLNNPADMLDSTPNYLHWDNGANIFNLGGQWQIFIQAYTDPTVGGSPIVNGKPTDFGGCEVWMGQNYGNLPFKQDSADSYSNDQWTAQLTRLNSPTLLSTGNTVSLQAGDVVAITGYGLEFEGMMNINEQHQINVTPPVFATSTSFSITALETGVPLPAPTVTTLGQLMDSSGNFYYDPTRQTGAEHLQGALVQLDGVRLLSGTWAPNNTVVVTDGSLRQMILHIANNPNLTAPPTTAVNVTGILDQESTELSNQNGYTLWLTDSGNVSPMPNSGGTFNCSGSGGSWNTAGNWNLGGKPQKAGDAAILGGSLALAATITLDGPQKVGGLIFANSNSATTGYTLSPGTGGTLTLDNSGATAFLTVISGSHTITAPLTLADNLDAAVAAGASLTLSGGIGQNSPGLSLSEDGGGLLVLSGTNTYSGGTTVNAGTLFVASNTALADGTSLTVGSESIFEPSAVAAPNVATAALSISPVPEPGALALLAVALAGFLLNCPARRKYRE